ncbi:MAG: TylF/MycF/NovP-related O-methyltransferase [Bacteroidota bacterium]|nr:TylF/MycF/NovP-related O-methyltransferase [Bacteroidota bacterium]
MNSTPSARISKIYLISRLFQSLKTALVNPKKIVRILKKQRDNFYESRLNSQWSKQDYILKEIDHCDKAFYETNKTVPEIEHQVGRYLNMKTICSQIIAEGLDGDIVEFGTWQGLGLILFSRCFSNDNTNRKFIGIDSFEGLPESSTIWIKGSFDNTSVELTKKNIQSKFFQNQSFSVELIKGWFSDPSVKEKLSSLSKEIALVHFDADLGSSTTQALSLIEPYLINRTKPIYFLFDDWGCHPDEVPEAFLSWLSTAGTTFKLQAHKLSSTRFTRYYKITFNN